MRAHGFYIKAGFCQYVLFGGKHWHWEGHTAAGQESRPNHLSWAKDLCTSCPACHPMCTQVAFAFVFQLKSSMFKPCFLCQNTSQPAITRWLLLSLFQHLFIHMDWNPVCWRQHACCYGRDEDFILCLKAIASGQTGFLLAPLQAVSHSLAESTPTRVMLETTEICPEGNSRNTE